jgi:endonuclease/exonuclease/phosphatase (EEP) superfamily protein YafD
VADLEQRFEAAGLERTSSATAPTIQFESIGLTLDHIFVRGMAVLATGAADEAAASDHLPIWATLRPVQ